MDHRTGGTPSEDWPRIRGKLLDGIYAVTPVRRVEIPKPNGGVRCLGIPTVLDRFIQQLLLRSWGGSSNRGSASTATGSDRDAALRCRESGREYVVRGRDWVVSKFFDLPARRIGAVIRDKRVLKLPPVVVGAGRQGGPLSPLLANLYLDPLDKELERRGYCFVRYADDCNRRGSDRGDLPEPAEVDREASAVEGEPPGVGRPWGGNHPEEKWPRKALLFEAGDYRPELPGYMKMVGASVSRSSVEEAGNRPALSVPRPAPCTSTRLQPPTENGTSEGAGAQSPAPDPIQLLPNMAHVAAVGGLVGRVAIHAEGHGGGLLLNQDLSLGHRTVAGGAFDLGVHGVQSV